MRNQKIIIYGLVILMGLAILSTLLVGTPVSATAIIGRCPEGFTSVPDQAGNPVDRNGNTMICGLNPPGQIQPDKPYFMYIDDIVVCTTNQVAACRVPKGPG